MELNCKIFVWWNGDLEDVILSLNKWKIFEVFYLIEYEIIEDMLEKIVNVGYSFKNNDDINIIVIKSEDKEYKIYRVMIKFELKDKLKEWFDDYIRK